MRRLVEPLTNSEIACYPIHSILFCARGPAESEERRCFAFTCSHGDSVETAIFQCHVFRCDVTEAVVPAFIICHYYSEHRLTRHVVNINYKDALKATLCVTGAEIQ